MTWNGNSCGKLREISFGFQAKAYRMAKGCTCTVFFSRFSSFCPASTNSFIILRSRWVKGIFLQTETPSFFQFPNKGYVRKLAYFKSMNACFFLHSFTCFGICAVVKERMECANLKRLSFRNIEYNLKLKNTQPKEQYLNEVKKCNWFLSFFFCHVGCHLGNSCGKKPKVFLLNVVFFWEQCLTFKRIVASLFDHKTTSTYLWEEITDFLCGVIIL